MDNILLIAGGAVTFTKVLVDIIRMATDLPRWAPPLLALLVSPLIVWALLVADGVTVIGAQESATIGLAGILAAGGAVGVSELQKHVERRP